MSGLLARKKCVSSVSRKYELHLQAQKQLFDHCVNIIKNMYKEKEYTKFQIRIECESSKLYFRSTDGVIT